MKATLLDGSPSGDTHAAITAHAVRQTLESSGAAVRHFRLAGIEIASCAGDFKCWTRTPGLCAIDDANREIARAFVQSDIAVFLTPVTFGGYSSELKKAVDHLIQDISPFFKTIGGETHHHRRYPRYPRLLAVGIQPESDADSAGIFEALVRRNALNMQSPGWACGLVYRSDGPESTAGKVRDLLLRAGALQ